MISLEDYQSLEETAYLLRSPNNAKRLLDSISALEKRESKYTILSNTGYDEKL